MPDKHTVISLLLLGLILPPSNLFALKFNILLETEVALLDEAFYAGEASDGSDIAGRFVLSAHPSSVGTRVAFIGFNRATVRSALFTVNVGDPSSWQRITVDIGFADFFVTWTPDDSALIWNRKRIPIETGVFEDHFVQNLDVQTNASVTRMKTGNWLVTTPSFSPQITMLPILPNGQEDLTREPTIVFNASIPNANEPTLATDGTSLVFSDLTDVPPGVPDQSDIYVLKNLPAILAAPKIEGTIQSTLAPITLADPNIVAIRTTESDNFAHNMFFSEDGKFIIYGEDFNGVFNDDDFVNTIQAGQWDVVVSNADGTDNDFRLQTPVNEAAGVPFPGGTRLTFIKAGGGAFFDARLFAAEVVFVNPFTGSQAGNNNLALDSAQSAVDASGTEIQLQNATLIDFPTGEAQEISICTPLAPPAQSEIPTELGFIAVPTVRDFGPAGTTFDRPATVTIHYTDAEVSGLIESTIRPMIFNDASGRFDIAVPAQDILAQDFDANTITFTITQSAKFGLAASDRPITRNDAQMWRMYR